MNGLLNVYKPAGATPLQIVNKMKKMLNIDQIGVKVAYAGRLDPLASGGLLLMVGDTCKRRDEYQNGSKRYTFRLLLGVTTDTLDPMGLITRSSTPRQYTLAEIKKACSKFVGEISQRYPLYSSYAIDGKPMYSLARAGEISDEDRASKLVNISEIIVKGIEKVELGAFVSKYSRIISEVNGDFRQTEIIKQWEKLSEENSEDLYSIELEAEVGSGTYIRSLSEDIDIELGTVGLAYDIVRTEVGEFNIINSIKL